MTNPEGKKSRAPNPALDEPGDLLGEWISDAGLAEALGVALSTLSRWESDRIGPPRIKVGGAVYYRRETVREWLRDKDRQARIRAWGQEQQGGPA